MVTIGDWCFTDGDPCFTNWSKESSISNPHKVAKIDVKIRKMEKGRISNTAFANELPNSLVLLVKFIESVVISDMDWLSGTIGGIGE